MNGIQQWGGYGGQALVPQGLFGGMTGVPLGGLIGKGIGGLLPFQADPIQWLQQACAQQLQQQPMQQLAPQGFFGNLLGQIGQPLGSAIGGIFGQSGSGGSIGSALGQLGRLLPFQIDPVQLAYAQQAYAQQLAPQSLYGNLLGQIGQPLISSMPGYMGVGHVMANIAGPAGKLLPYTIDPIQQLQQAYAQQLQQLQTQGLAPQGFFGNLLGQIGQPLGSAIGGLFGQSGMGSLIGGSAGQWGRLLPFQADPLQQAMLQQLAQQQQQGYQASGQQGYSGGQQTLH